MIRKWTEWVNVGTAVLLGLNWVLLGFGAEWLAAAPGGIIGSAFWRTGFTILGLAILALNGWFLWRAYRAGGLRDNLRLTAVDGANMVAPDALEALFLRTLKGEPDLRNPRVALEVKSGQHVALHLRFGLREQADVVKRMEEVKALVRDRFARMLPEGVKLEIFVEIVELIAADAQTPGVAAPEPPKEFDGPIYSDEGDTHDQPLA